MPDLHDLPQDERPRERLLSKGVDALSLTELLALSLRSGYKGRSVLSLAEELLTVFGGVTELTEASLQELTTIRGIGIAKAAQMKGIFSLAKRLAKKGGKAKCCIRSPQDVYSLIEEHFIEKKQEIVVVLFRDARGFVFHDEIVAIGILSEVLIHPRELFRLAIRHCAYSIILAHNHPSGDPTPSKQDLELTKLLAASGSLLGIPLDDHLIFGRGSYTSLWERGIMRREKY